MRVYLVRHGETQLNERGCYYGWLDTDLNEKGRAQARYLGEGLHSVDFDYIYCSPLLRARETARILLETAADTGNCNPCSEQMPMTQDADHFAGHVEDMGFSCTNADWMKKYDISFDERLKEQNFGCFEGCTYSDLKAQYPEELYAWNKDYFHYQIPEGESFVQVRERIDAFLMSLTDEEKLKRDTNILIVAHKGTLGHLMASMLHMPLEGYWNFVFEQGCYNRVDLEDGYAIVRKLNQSV